jgi:ribonucleoside-diphosphate reductase beta chain
MLQKKLLFNPAGNDTASQRKLINGNTTNLIDLQRVKYRWATQMYRTMMSNFWIPEKVDLSSDVIDYSKLTSGERRAYNGILSFLVFLDSLQTNNVPHIADYITAPEVNLVLAVHTYQEAVHSQSYQYIIESIIPVAERESIYDFWREDSVLAERNRFIAGTFQSFLDESTESNFYKVLIANYLLEGIYFYNGFNFFYNLAARHLMVGTADVIGYINKDELTHVNTFQKIISELLSDIPWDSIYEMTDTAVQQEITWTNHIIGNEVLGINNDSTDQYTKYIANMRLRALGLDTLYTDSKYSRNPYKHLSKISDTAVDVDVKGNFFEATILSYSQSTAVGGWDDF